MILASLQKVKWNCESCWIEWRNYKKNLDWKSIKGWGFWDSWFWQWRMWWEVKTAGDVVCTQRCKDWSRIERTEGHKPVRWLLTKGRQDNKVTMCTVNKPTILLKDYTIFQQILSCCKLLNNILKHFTILCESSVICHAWADNCSRQRIWLLHNSYSQSLNFF